MPDLFRRLKIKLASLHEVKKGRSSLCQIRRVVCLHITLESLLAHVFSKCTFIILRGFFHKYLEVGASFIYHINDCDS